MELDLGIIYCLKPNTQGSLFVDTRNLGGISRNKHDDDKYPL